MLKSMLIFPIVLLFITNCAQQLPVYQKTAYYDLVDKNQMKQTKGDITVELMPLDDNEYKKSFYYQNIEVVHLPFLADQPEIIEKQFGISYYDGLTAFKISIINNTDHILRMRDARIAFIDPDSDEPIMALNKRDILDDVESNIPYYKKLRAYVLINFPKTRPSDVEDGVIKAITKVTKKIKFINGFNKEILPDMKISGILLFPITPEQASQGKISFIDLVSKTDNAGRPIEKVRMDYAIKEMFKYWRYDPKLKSWEEVNKTDYEKGISIAKNNQKNAAKVNRNTTNEEDDF